MFVRTGFLYDFINQITKISKYGIIGDCWKFKRFDVSKENKNFKSVDGNLYTKDDDLFKETSLPKEEEITIEPFVQQAIEKKNAQTSLYDSESWN